MKKFYHKIPESIQSVLLSTEGWLVGRAVNDLLENKIPNDWDIIVPNREKFQEVCKLLGAIGNLKINSYGGIKYKEEGEDEDNYYIIDIWCEELDHFLKNTNSIQYVYNYKKSILLKKES